MLAKVLENLKEVENGNSIQTENKQRGKLFCN